MLFRSEDFREIFEPIGDILELESDPSGGAGVGIIIRKNSENMTSEQAEKWLEKLRTKKLLNMSFGKCSFAEFEERENRAVTIALVMIVKNEAKCLERCIESVRPIVDEFVIVDTGSTDGTQDIIKKYGKLYEIPFVNYVETKNHALSLAKSDYILFMDADEYVIEGMVFLQEHARTGTECVLGKIIEGTGDRKSVV